MLAFKKQEQNFKYYVHKLLFEPKWKQNPAEKYILSLNHDVFTNNMFNISVCIKTTTNDSQTVSFFSEQHTLFTKTID